MKMLNKECKKDKPENQTRKRKTRRDFALFGSIVLAAGVLAFALYPIITGGVTTRNYQVFVDNYTSSMGSARTANSAVVQLNGEQYRVTADAAGKVYNLLLIGGMGKPQKQAPEGEPAALLFPDGSSIEFWEVQIPEKVAKNETGLFVRYTKEDGYLYQYDTDKLTLGSVVEILKKAVN